jgi:hypothetical protein
LLLALASGGHVHAATICVHSGDVVGLKAALATAEQNGEDDLIEVETGQYYLSDADTLSYYPSVEQRSLTIEGGYSEFFSNPCEVPPSSPDARQTVLDGGHLSLTLPDGAGSINLKSITVRNTVSNNQHSVPVIIGGLANSTGNLYIYNSIFSGNSSLANAAIFFGASSGTLVVQNSLFESNASFAGMSPIGFSGVAINNLCMEVVNSTFTQNASSQPGVRISTPACVALVANSIFWGNSGGDINIGIPAMTSMVNDDLGNLDEAANTQAVNLLSINPMFNPDFSLQDTSPLRDAGSTGNIFFSPGNFDVIGSPRIYGTNPDIGAFEIQDVIFASAFD